MRENINTTQRKSCVHNNIRQTNWQRNLMRDKDKFFIKTKAQFVKII